MEFIPIGNYNNKKNKNKNKGVKPKKDSEVTESLKQKETAKLSKKTKLKKFKVKSQIHKVDVRKLKEKKKKVFLKNNRKGKEEENIEEDDDDDDEEEEDFEMKDKDGDVDDAENYENRKDESERKKLEEKLKRRREELDAKKKNRLFVKFPKKIINEAQVKELHPDIRVVIFPRKKKSRWCWAVFASEERANEALKKLLKKEGVVVTKPNPHEQVEMKREKKMRTIQHKKETRKKLQQMWM